MVTNRKARILEEATRLFSRDGYDRVSTRSLAQSCGISEPALYRHFSSKEKIYDAVLDSIPGRLNCAMLFTELEKETDIEIILEALASHIVEFLSTNQDLYRLLLFTSLKGHPKAGEVFRVLRGTYINFLKTQLDRLYRKGLILKKRNDITARCFVGMVFDCAMGLAMWDGYSGRRYQPVTVIANNIPIYARGLRE